MSIILVQVLLLVWLTAGTGVASAAPSPAFGATSTADGELQYIVVHVLTVTQNDEM
jgi:hypothetical protein